MALRNRIWRILKENKGRYVGIFILIFLGSFMFVLAKGSGDNLGRFVGGFAERKLQEDISFSTDIPIADIPALERESGAVIDTYRYYDVTLSAGQPLRLLSPCSKLNIPAVKTGRELQKPDEILLDPYFCSTHGISIGDSMDVNGRAFSVVGTVALPHYVYALKNINDVLPPSGFGIGLIPDEAFAQYPDAVTVYSARFIDRGSPNTQSAHLHELLINEGHSLSDWADAKTNKRIQMPWASITGIKAMSVPIPIFMFLMCCLIISVMIRRMVRADGVVIGTLYALGYRHKELTRHYMAIPIMLAVSGALLGILIALPLIGPIVSAFIGTYYNVPNAGIERSIFNAVIGLLMPICFLGISCLLVIRKELRKTAGELMKGDSQKTNINFLERNLRLERFQFRTKFQLREQLRSMPRLLFLFFGVAAASVMMLFGFTINNSMNVVFSSTSDDMYKFAYEYSFKQVQHGDAPAGTEAFNAIRCYPEGRESVEFYVMGIQPDSTGIILRDASGNQLPTNQVNVSYPLASRLKLQTGESISFVNKLDGKAYSLKVDNIVKTYSGQFIYMPISEFNGMTNQPGDSYSGLFSMEVLEIDDRLIAGVKNMQEVSGSMDDLAGPMIAAVAFITAISALMGIIIIFIVTSLIIEESRITISLLRVFGYRGKEVRKLVLNSSTLVVILGFCLGLPLMLVMANAMYGYLGEMINIVLPMIVSPVYILISFILIMLVYELAKWLCGRKLEKISMHDAIKAGTE